MKRFLLVVVLCLGIALPYADAKGGQAGGARGGAGRHGGVSASHPGRTAIQSLPSTGTRSYGVSGGGFSGGSRGSYVSGSYYQGHYYPGGYYGGNERYYYRGYAPHGAVFGFFLGGAVIGGARTTFWWPYYAVAVPQSYYDPYYQYPYPAPPYVIEVPPAEATTAYPQGPQIIEVPPPGVPAIYPIGPQPTPTAPNQCYAPKTDARGTIIKENGNMVPDFAKPVPCPS